MIARLRGLIETLGDSYCVIDVNGVGYLVFCSSRTLGTLIKGAAASLLTEMQVREDAITLYGFATTGEREWFRLLTTVQGVGAKVALAILSALSPDQLIAAISAQDRAALTRAPGVGPKLAIRLVTELREKAGVMPGGGAAPLPLPPTHKPHQADALSALLNLGYRHAEAQTALAHAIEHHGEDAPLDVLIRGALRVLSK
jgi:Holliday junction DNA helicase RuvA